MTRRKVFFQGSVLVSFLASLVLFSGCAKDEEEVTYADSDCPYLTIGGYTILAAKETEVNTWFDTEHIPQLMGYSGLKEANRCTRYQARIDTTIPMYYTTYHFDTKAGIDSMVNVANTNMQAKWPPANGECTADFLVTYEKMQSWVKPGVTTRPSIMQIVAYEFAPATADAVNDWYNNIIMPKFMKYEGLLQSARYKKMGAASDINSAGFPTFLTVYYYPTKEDQQGLAVGNPIFDDVMANEAATWPNNELLLQFVLWTTNSFTQKK